MASTPPSDALVLAWNLEREVHNRPDSKQKAVIAGLLTLATTAAFLAHELASKSTRDTVQDYCDIQDQMGLGLEAAEVALTEAIESFDPDETTTRPLATTSVTVESGSDGKAQPQPSEATNDLHKSELEHSSDTVPSERIIELIAGHVQTRLQTTLVGTLIHPLTNALIDPLTDALVHPLTTNVLSRLITMGRTGPVGDTPSDQQLLVQPPNPLVDEGFPFSVVKSFTALQGSSSARRATALDPVATSSSGFSKSRPRSYPENAQKKRRTRAPL